MSKNRPSELDLNEEKPHRNIELGITKLSISKPSDSTGQGDSKTKLGVLKQPDGGLRLQPSEPGLNNSPSVRFEINSPADGDGKEQKGEKVGRLNSILKNKSKD